MNIPFRLIKDALTEQRKLADELEERIDELQDRLRQKYEQLSDMRQDIQELEEFLRSHGENYH